MLQVILVCLVGSIMFVNFVFAVCMLEGGDEEEE